MTECANIVGKYKIII